jgi:uncharacterized repeat protein (TIGR04076 family)
MEGYYNVKVEVIDQTGKCFQGHKVGDSWIVKHKTPDGICLSAFAAMYGRLTYLEYGGSAPWKKTGNPDESKCVCPDVKNPVVFKLTRLREE